MTEYETILIARPDWSNEQVRHMTDRLAAIIERGQGTIFHMKEVGKRRLAYRVKKQTRGTYVYCNYAGGGNMVAEIERVLRYDEDVLKFLTVKMGEVESVDTRKAKALEEEARLAQLFGAGSDAPVTPAGSEYDDSPEQASFS